MWVVFAVPVCLHSQEVEEDPQGAGKAPELWLTALAANPVHLLSKNEALKGIHVNVSAQAEERKGWKGGGNRSFQEHTAL